MIKNTGTLHSEKLIHFQGRHVKTSQLAAIKIMNINEVSIKFYVKLRIEGICETIILKLKSYSKIAAYYYSSMSQKQVSNLSSLLLYTNFI